MTESKEELKSLLMKVKEKSVRADLKLNIQKMKVMESSPITSLQKDGKKMETMSDFISLGSKITADGNCSHEKTLASWKKIYDQPRQHIRKQKHYFANKVCPVKAMMFCSHVWMGELDHKEG